MFRNPFSKKRQNTQPETAKLAHRAVTLARLAELYNVDLSHEGAAMLAGRLAGVPDAELAAYGAKLPLLIGCPRGIPQLFAGYSRGCGECPYYNVRAPVQESGGHCALKEE